MTELTNTALRPHLKLIKNTKGYSWEIKIYGDDLDEAFEAIGKLNQKFSNEYGSGE